VDPLDIPVRETGNSRADEYNSEFDYADNVAGAEPDDRTYAAIKAEQEDSVQRRHLAELNAANRTAAFETRVKPAATLSPADINLRRQTLGERVGDAVKWGVDRARNLGRNTRRVGVSAGGRRTRRRRRRRTRRVRFVI
jgi:hypothetical protein